MRFFGEGGFITGIGKDEVRGFIVRMQRTPIVRVYWYSTYPQARRAAMHFKRTGKWPRKKTVRNVLRLPVGHGIIPK